MNVPHALKETHTQFLTCIRCFSHITALDIQCGRILVACSSCFREAWHQLSSRLCLRRVKQRACLWR